MAIYRGPGGAGDANSDITINLVTELTQEAEEHKDAAASSAAAALASQQAAATSETNASPVNAIVSEITTVAGISSDVTTVAGIDSDVTTVSGNNANVTTVAGISSNVTAVAGNNANVTTVATDIANVNTTATNITNVNTVAGISSDVTAVVADATDIGTVATDLTGSDTIGTVATNIANVNTVAGISSDVTAVVADQADIGTVSTNIANVNTVAGVSTDVTTVAGISSDVTAVAADATDIGTVATNIANVNTVATNNTNVTTVATNIADVQAAATNIADIQAVADEVAKVITVANDLNEATSEIDTVANSIANVDTVGTNITAVNNVSANIDSVNNFGDTYFVSATAPSSPTEGDLWFDTTNQVMKVYTDSGFANAGSSVNGTSERQNYVVGTSSGTYDGSTTVFPATYDAGYVDVYLNGVKLVVGTDFTATNGTSITLSSAATSGDAVNIIGYGTFELSNFSINDANDVSLSGITNGQVLAYNSTSGDLEPTTIISDVVGDATPQLGGNLDLNSNDITGTGNINVDGTVTADGLTLSSASSPNLNITDTTNTVTTQIASTDTQGFIGTITNHTFQIVSNGTKRLRIESNGDINLGYEDTGTTPKLFWDASAERLGIGTTSPQSALDVNGTTRTVYLLTSNDIILGGSNNGDIYGSDDTQRLIIAGGTKDSGATLRLFGGTHSSLAKQMYLDADTHIFRAENATGERMRIDSSGRVGIGTTTPRALMDFGVGTGDAATISTTISDYQIVFDAPGGTGDYARNIGWCSGTTSIVAGITTKDEGGNTATGVRFLAGSTLGLSDVGGFSSGGNFLMDSGYGSAATAYGCRAWVNFNGTGTVASRGSGNVSSVGDIGTGVYRVNFSTSMPDANYAVVTYNNAASGTGVGNFANHYGGGAGDRTTAKVDVRSFSGSDVDAELFDVIVLR